MKLCMVWSSVVPIYQFLTYFNRFSNYLVLPLMRPQIWNCSKLQRPQGKPELICKQYTCLNNKNSFQKTTMKNDIWINIATNSIYFQIIRIKNNNNNETGFIQSYIYFLYCFSYKRWEIELKEIIKKILTILRVL
jgi:hypothetical protein